jgi:hypothetical protein
MNLERVEELCLRYLGQAVNPLVPVVKLHAYLVREDAEQAPSMSRLLDFLRHHAEIIVLDGPGEGDPVGAEGFAAAGFMMGPRAMVKTRVPSRAQMLAMMFEQIDEMRERLDTALESAREARNAALVAQVEEAIRRSEDLRMKIQRMAQAAAN